MRAYKNHCCFTVCKQLPKEIFSPITLECQDEKKGHKCSVTVVFSLLSLTICLTLMLLGQRLSFINFTEISQVALVGDVLL